MSIRRKGAACDPCCNDWKEKLKFLWEKYREAVRGIKAGAQTFYPDGEGIVTMPGVPTDIDLYDEGTHWVAVIDTESSRISLTDLNDYWRVTID